MSKLSAKHISDVISLLNERTEYAVLRNFEGLPDKNKSRDIDIIITRSSYRKVKNELVRLIDASGWKIVTYLHSDRLITYVCAKQEGEVTELVQWDFFMNTSVWGILLMDAKEFLEHRQYNGFLYHVGVECQFLDKYLYNRAVGTNIPKKYQWMRDEVEQHDGFVKEKVRRLYGCKSLEECDRKPRPLLALKAVWTNMKRRPMGLVGDIASFLWTFVSNYLHSRTGFSIGFTGPDGSGKTTVIDLMIESMGAVFRKAHAYLHFRPALFGNLGEVAHSAGVKKSVDRNFSDPHRGGRTGAVNSLLRLAYYSVDYIVGYFLRVKTVTRITRLVIFDRYYTDIICDSRRSRIYLPTKLLYWYGRLFIPRLDYNILLTASTDTILSRKQELDREGIETINGKIDYLASKPGYYKIVNDGTPHEAVAKILSTVFERQHEKNKRRI